MAALPLRALLVALLAAYTNALLVGTRPALAPKVQLRAQEAPPPPPKGKLGATVDQDGKSNVWAVEPTMKVEKEDKGLLAFAPVALVGASALLLVPLLPVLFGSNPDQV
eukprot:CAMPEP_0119063496 /NCGR_PEP_ID=MMETSP1178-20130426/6823_1 /TAXON_ID=33656 /ORGANISM="unid sp, Strain CCMP2000" /LENGTH=108 /DNA_ID=CAMNT_0007044867 /DNA_START=25 /DNA_END=351 /DNA_ORIENTATION=-